MTKVDIIDELRSLQSSEECIKVWFPKNRAPTSSKVADSAANSLNIKFEK